MLSGTRAAWIEERFPALPDLRTGVLIFALFAGFALSPLGRQLDRLTYVRPLRPGMSGFDLARHYLDHIASQGGEAIVMAGLAVLFTALLRTSLPLVIAGATEGLFYFTGLIKIGFAKDAPRFGTPSYWAGGFLEHSKFGMAFPSGHTSESVFVFGTIVLLVHLALPRWSARHLGAIKLVWVAVILNAAIVSWALGTHWVTDLIGGMLFGGVMLRVLVLLVSRGYAGRVAAAIDERAVRVTVALLPGRVPVPQLPEHRQRVPAGR